MNLGAIGVLLAVITGAASIAGYVYIFIRVKANEVTINAQRELISTYKADIDVLRDKLEQALAENEQLREQNVTLRGVVTQAAEIASLHLAEDRHHEETMTVLLAIQHALEGRDA